jgi:hypothetical protein
VGSGNVGAANAELASIRTAVSAYQSENNGALPVGATQAGPVAAYAAGSVETVVNSVLSATTTGFVSGGIKGYYKVDASGVVISAANGTNGWPLTIVFDTETDGTVHWVKGTSNDATTFHN